MSDLLDRSVGGMRCREVLEGLSAFMDGELSRDDVARVRAHLEGCDRCERFGGRFAQAMVALRVALGPADSLAPEIAARLRARLQAG